MKISIKFLFVFLLVLTTNISLLKSQFTVCDECEAGFVKTIIKSKDDEVFLKIGDNRYRITYESYKCCNTSGACTYGVRILKVVGVTDNPTNQDLTVQLYTEILRHIIKNSKRYLDLPDNVTGFAFEVAYPSCLPNKLNATFSCSPNCCKIKFQLMVNGLSGQVANKTYFLNSDCGNVVNQSCVSLCEAPNGILTNEQFYFATNIVECNEDCYWTLNGNNIDDVVGENNWFGSKNNKDVIFKTNNIERVRLYKDGKIAMGSNGNTPVVVPDGYLLGIKGKLITEEIMVQLYGTWPDYVFGSQYKLMDLSEVEKYVVKNKSLPGIPNEQEVKEKGGIELGQLNKLLLEKLEENTLYLINLSKQNEALRKEVEILKEKVK